MLRLHSSLPHTRQMENVWLVPADVLRAGVKFGTNVVRQDTCAVPVFVTIYASDCPGDIGPLEMPGKLSVTQQELLGEEGRFVNGQAGAASARPLSPVLEVLPPFQTRALPFIFPALKEYTEWYQPEANDKNYGAADFCFKSSLKTGDYASPDLQC